MPELAEVAHAVSNLRCALIGKKIIKIVANEDPIVFVSPLNSVVFEKTLKNKIVESIDRAGKYFWFRFKSSSDVLVMHFGMTGWFYVKGVKTHFLVMENGGDKKALAMKKGVKSSTTDEPEVWPPRFTKFTIDTEDDKHVAFIDPRRLSRVRLLTALTNDDLLNQEPLSKLGPDYSITKGRPTFDEFKSSVISRKVPIKSLLLDQSVFSGVGNWISDEILYHSRIHPQIQSNLLSENQLKNLYNSLIMVCETAAKLEGNTQAFPDDWLMLYRWGKRNKKGTSACILPNGHKVDHITVGGRTSCYVPDLQKKKIDTLSYDDSSDSSLSSPPSSPVSSSDLVSKEKSVTRKSQRNKKKSIDTITSIKKTKDIKNNKTIKKKQVDQRSGIDTIINGESIKKGQENPSSEKGEDKEDIKRETSPIHKTRSTKMNELKKKYSNKSNTESDNVRVKKQKTNK